MLLGLLIGILAQDIEGLIERLGDADPAVREEAARKLERMGSRPLDALKKAAGTTDPERRVRAETLAVHAARERVQEAREAEERPKKVKLLAKDVSTLEPGTAATDGALFKITRKPWPSGTIFETVVDKKMDGDLEWTIASAATDRVLKLETCAFHSPGLVFVAEAGLQDPKLTIRGRRRWFCETPVEFKEPKLGDVWRSGAYAVVVRWPELVVQTDTPEPEALLSRTLHWTSIEIQVKEGVVGHDVIGGGAGGGGGYRSKLVPRAERAWCGCQGKPSDRLPEPPKVVLERRERSVRYDDVPLSNISRIKARFHKPVEEPFEATSRPLE